MESNESNISNESNEPNESNVSNESTLSPKMYKQILKFQKDEINGSLLYERIAKRQKDEKNRAVLMEIAQDERGHYETWKRYTGRDVRPDRLKVYFFLALSLVLGFTFTIKYFEKGERLGIEEIRRLEEELPEMYDILNEEEKHEATLMEMMDEERLHYVGSMVLGLNDALVELTGAIAGLTFALANTRLVALSAIIMGVSATLSMAASNYLAERADGNQKALKSSAYTGIAYLVTVVLMVIPYLLLPNELYVTAFAVMIAVVIFIIFVFNYYISVAQSLPFWKRFAEMTAISLGVAVISFIIGLGAKVLLGIDVM